MNTKLKILLVEDLPTDIELIQREIKKTIESFELQSVDSQKAFVAALRSFKPDIILSDFSLPGFDGLSALQIAKKEAAVIPFIMVTGSMDENTAVKCMKAGASDYIIKEHLKRLGPAIKSALKQKEISLERKNALNDLHESEERYRNILNVAPVGIIVCLDEEIVYSNPFAQKLLGAKKSEELLGKSIYSIINHESHAVFNKEVQILMNQKSFYKPGEYVFERLDRAQLTVELNLSQLTFKKKVAIQLIFSDITERKKTEQELLYLSYHDTLTELYNRRYFEEKLYQFDSSSMLPLTILMADLNGLKIINDSFGHAVGDELLIKVAHRLKKSCAQKDIVARVGGDEFAVIMPKTTAAEAQKRLKLIRDNLSDLRQNQAVLSISFGLATKNNIKQEIQKTLTEAENAMFRQKIFENSSMRNKIIDVIMNALFEKSKREMMHSKRVSLISAAIAKEMGLQKADIDLIKMAGLIHDIGKIGIDEKILNKPAKLTKDEWIEMKKHPEAGWRILASASDYTEIAEFVLTHHEKWDGTGYPQGLAGEQIPLEARIIAVADAFDAMTSKRPYRDPVAKEKSVQELSRYAGSQFDPEVVGIFIAKVLNNEQEFLLNYEQ